MANELGQLVASDLLQIKAGIADLTHAQPSIAPAMGGSVSGNTFADRMMDAIHSVNAQDHEASAKMAAVDSGASDDLVGAMLASQEAGLSFSMLMQVRNKVMGAVEDLIKLPI